MVLVGDAAHTCPPMLARGGAMAHEDTAVLAEVLLAGDAVDRDLRTPSAPAGSSASAPSSTPPTSSPRRLLDHVQGDAPALLRRIAALTSRPA